MNNGCHVAKNSRIKQAWDNHHAETKNLNRKSLKYKALCCLKKYIQGVHEKLCFFTIHCNPSLAYIAVRDLQSSQREASVQSLLLAGNFLYSQLQPSAGEGEVANFREFLEKNTIFNEHPVLPSSTPSSNRYCNCFRVEIFVDLRASTCPVLNSHIYLHTLPLFIPSKRI